MMYQFIYCDALYVVLFSRMAYFALHLPTFHIPNVAMLHMACVRREDAPTLPMVTPLATQLGRVSVADDAAGR